MTRFWRMSKREADYGPAPSSDVRCARCRYMFPHGSVGACRLVRGVVTGSAGCTQFMPRTRS